MTWDILLQTQLLISKQQLRLQAISCILSGIAITLTYIIFNKQLKISKKQIIQWTINMISADISVWQSKLEHMTSLGMSSWQWYMLSEDDWNKLLKWIIDIRKSLNSLYKARNKLLKDYENFK